MKNALISMGNPCKDIPAIQIAGTNGKGSIASFISSGLQTLDIKAGTTTSPHLLSWCERISTNGINISSEELSKRLRSLQDVINNFKLTPFESLIAAALDHFNEQRVKLLVLEVGLGGRLDATTAHSCRPIIAMAAIGLDHCEHLGNNLTQITKEKAAIITPGSTIISAEQHPEVQKVLLEVVAFNKAHIHIVKPITDEWKLGIPGEIQKQNAAVAKAAIESLAHYGWSIDQKKIKEGFKNATWPGRLQNAKWNNMPLLVDCAHNPHATKQLSIETNKLIKGDSAIHWILAIQRHKDGPKMLHSLLKTNDYAWIVEVPGYTSWSKEDLIKITPKYRNQLRSALNVEDALSLIYSKSNNENPFVVIAGSIYLIGDLIKRKQIHLESIN